MAELDRSLADESEDANEFYHRSLSARLPVLTYCWNLGSACTIIHNVLILEKLYFKISFSFFF